MKVRHKLVNKMRNNPLDWRIEQLETVAKCKEEGVSLNTLVISLLAADVGYKKI